MYSPYSHASFKLWSGLFVHFDEATAVVHKHAVLVSSLYVHPEDEVQLFGLLQGSWKNTHTSKEKSAAWIHRVDGYVLRIN